MKVAPEYSRKDSLASQHATPLCTDVHGRLPPAVAVVPQQPSSSTHPIPAPRWSSQGLAALAPGVAASSALRLLNLERKGITPAGCASLAAALAAAPHGGGQLEEVLLGQNDVGAEGVAALLAALRPSLRELDLSACALEGAAGAAPLAAALRQGSLPRLRSLRLNGNTLGPAAAAELAPALSDAACSLEALHVQRCGFDSGAAAALAAAAPASLQRLDLSGNALGADGGVALAAALAGGAAPSLRSLLLCGCSLDDGGIAALVEALTTARKAAAGAAPASLALDLSGNTAGAAALAALAGAPLTSLCLHDCKIGGGGAAADGTADGTADGAAAAAAAVAAVVDRLAEPGAFCQLAELDVSGNRLQVGGRRWAERPSVLSFLVLAHKLWAHRRTVRTVDRGPHRGRPAVDRHQPTTLGTPVCRQPTCWPCWER